MGKDHMSIIFFLNAFVNAHTISLEESIVYSFSSANTPMELL